MDNNKDFGTLEKLCEDILNDMDTYDSILLGFGTELLKYKNSRLKTHNKNSFHKICLPTPYAA